MLLAHWLRVLVGETGSKPMRAESKIDLTNWSSAGVITAMKADHPPTCKQNKPKK
jgi:hypothetical protein